MLAVSRPTFFGGKMTPFLKVLTEYCTVYVDDERLNELRVSNMPVYANTLMTYFRPAITRFSIPNTMQDYLVGSTGEHKNIIESRFGTYRFVAEDNISEYTVSLGEEYIGYELFAASEIKRNGIGELYTIPAHNAEYNSATGDIVLHGDIAKGTIYDFDFYSDGAFKNSLTMEIMNILGLCFQLVWENRFSENWLDRVPQIDDKSFSVQNKANKQNADTARLKELSNNLYSAMRRYEQKQYYKHIVSRNN